MKTKNSKKLKLKKRTIANLNKGAMNNLKGGALSVGCVYTSNTGGTHPHPGCDFDPTSKECE